MDIPWHIATILILYIILNVNGLAFPRPMPIDPINVALSFEFANHTAITLDPNSSPLISHDAKSHYYSSHLIYVTHFNDTDPVNDEVSMPGFRIPDTISQQPLVSRNFREFMNVGEDGASSAGSANAAVGNSVTGATDTISLFDRTSVKAFGFISDIIGVVADLTTITILVEEEFQISKELDLLNAIIKKLGVIEDKLDDLSREIKDAVTDIDKYIGWNELINYQVTINELFVCMLISGNLTFQTDVHRSSCCPNNWQNKNVSKCELEAAQNINSVAKINLIGTHHKLFTKLTGSAAYGGTFDIQSGFLYIYAKAAWNQYFDATKAADGTYDLTTFDYIGWYSTYSNYIFQTTTALTHSSRILIWATCIIQGKHSNGCYKMWYNRSQDVVSYNTYASYNIPDIIRSTLTPIAINMTRHCNISRNTTGSIKNVTCSDYEGSKIAQRLFVSDGNDCMCFAPINEVCFENDCQGNYGGWRNRDLGQGVFLDNSQCSNTYPSIYFNIGDSALATTTNNLGWWSNGANIISGASNMDFNLYHRNNSISMLWDTNDIYQPLTVFATWHNSYSLLTFKSNCFEIQKGHGGVCNIIGDNITNYGVTRIYASAMDSFDTLILNDEGRKFKVLLRMKSIYEADCKQEDVIRFITKGRTQIATMDCGSNGYKCNGHGCGDNVMIEFMVYTAVKQCSSSTSSTLTIIIISIAIGISLISLITLIVSSWWFYKTRRCWFQSHRQEYRGVIRTDNEDEPEPLS